MEATKITLNGKEYNFKMTVRALFYLERIKGDTEVKSMLDNFLLFYAIILACNDGVMQELDWDTFIASLDEDPTILRQMQSIIDAHNKRQELLESNKDTIKKKTTRKRKQD